MIVCVCHRVSDRDIARAVAAGCASFEELQFELGVATRCGRCGDCARDVFHQHAALAPAQPGCSLPRPRREPIPIVAIVPAGVPA